METRPMTVDEAKEEINKHGDYWSYRASTLSDPPLEKPALVQKSVADLTVDRFEWHAKAEGLTLEQYLKKHPEMYREYRELL